MEIVGMILGVLLLTGITTGAINGATTRGKSLVANTRAASAARKESRAQRKPLPDAKPAPAGVKVGQIAAGLAYGAALYGRAGWAGARAGWDAGREKAIDRWEERHWPLAEDVDLGVTPQEFLAGKKPPVPPQKRPQDPPSGSSLSADLPTDLPPLPEPTPEQRARTCQRYALHAIKCAEESGYTGSDVEKAAFSLLLTRHSTEYSQKELAETLKQVLRHRQAAKDNSLPPLPKDLGDHLKPRFERPRLVVDNTRVQPSGGTTMAVHTVTGGEVVNTETGLTEAQAKLKRATTEFEDATADYHRAREEFAVDERFATSVAALDFPQNVKDAAATCMEASKLRADSAQRRMTAAESAMNAARRLVTLFQGHHDMAVRAAELGGMANQSAYGR